MKHPSAFVFLLFITILTVSCARQAPSAASPMPYPPMLKPGDSLGDAVIDIAKDETGEPDVFTYCPPLITESDPRVIVRTCKVPQLSYLCIGYGELANTQEELDTLWKAKTWQFYFDEQEVDLKSFGFFDINWNEYKIRRWNIAVKNLTPGKHTLHYVIHDGSQKPEDVTWVFTIGDSSSTPSPEKMKILYPTLSSEVVTGQRPYTSVKAGLNFLLFLPANYGKDSHWRWPLILYLHGAGNQGNNLDYLKTGGLPQVLEKRSDFPALVVSPQGQGEYEFWAKESMMDSLFALMDEIQAAYSIDSNRVYLTGASAGGNGVWVLGLHNPHRFAALVPVMGYYGYPFTVPDNICNLKDVPIWAFHGAKDTIVPLQAEEGLIDALKQCNGKANLTVFPEAGHDVSNQVYSSSDLYQWLFAQAKENLNK